MADIAAANITSVRPLAGPTIRGHIWKVISDGTGVTAPLYGAKGYPYALGGYTRQSISGDTNTLTVAAGTNLSIRYFFLFGP